MIPLVSICCNVYNQEKYVEIMLDSILMQRTDFYFEILVHDDASTDGSAEIIKAYKRKYPNIIKPILQEENKYSQNIDIDAAYNFPRAAGKYIAYCEGDDYWTDPFKLKKQVDFLESHPEVSCSFHANKMVDEAGKKVIGYRRAFNQNHYLTVQEVISLEGQFAINSMVFLTKWVKDNSLPDYYYQSQIGDYPLILFLSMKGKIHYLNEIMSAYRWQANNSWTQRVLHIKENREVHFQRIKKMLYDFDSYSNYKYSACIEKQIYQQEFIQHLWDKNLRTVKSSKYSEFYSQLNAINKLKLYISHYFPLSVLLNRRLKKLSRYYWYKVNETFSNEP